MLCIDGVDIDGRTLAQVQPCWADRDDVKRRFPALSVPAGDSRAYLDYFGPFIYDGRVAWQCRTSDRRPLVGDG